MKRVCYILSLFLLVASCAGNDPAKTMTVSGVIKGLKKGTLYLQHVPDSTLTIIDSLEISGDGSFTFETQLESPEIFYLYLNKKDNNDMNDRITFFGEPGEIIINTNWNTFDTQAEVVGSDTDKKYQGYKNVMSQFNKKNLELLQASIGNETPLDSLQLDSLQKLSNRNIQKSYAFALNFALNNVNSTLAPYIAVNDVPDSSIKYLDSLHNALTPDVAKSKYGKDFTVLLEERKKSE